VLARLLALGCHTLKLTPDKPLVARGGDFVLVAAPLDPALLTPPVADTIPTDTPTPTVAATSIPKTERSNPVKPSEPSGPAPTREEPPDPLVVAEELRAALTDVLTKANRLVAALKHSRKEKKALAHVWAGLKQLNLETGDPR
jgi:hypothetical protein